MERQRTLVDRKMADPKGRIKYNKDPEGEALQDEIVQNLAQRAKVGTRRGSIESWARKRANKTGDQFSTIQDN